MAYDQLKRPPAVPSPGWFLASHVKDVFERLPVLEASITSTYGRILKIDSTKKVGILSCVQRRPGAGKPF